jgi:subtilisin family serine protease
LNSIVKVEALETVTTQSGIPHVGIRESLFNRQWYLHAQHAPEIKTGADINALEAWKITKGNPDIVVAVLDVGFDLLHPAFKRTGKIVYPSDYINGFIKPFQTHHLLPHGSCCAALSVGEDENTGFTSIAPGCSFMPVRIPLQAPDELLIKILEEIAQKADVISCSWSSSPINAPISLPVSQCITKIALEGGPRKKGCVICFGAGNYNAPVNDPHNKEFPWLDESIDQFIMARGPILNGFAAHPYVITVASSTSLNKKAVYSNWGKEISVCAPSNNYHPFNKQYKVDGRWDVCTAGNSRIPQLEYTNEFGGTSASTALVAGVAALILSVNAELTASDVKGILQNTAEKIVDKEPNQLPGHSRGEYNNGHSEWFGFGKVNAGKAVKESGRLLKMQKRS